MTGEPDKVPPTCSECGGSGWKDKIVGFTESTLSFHVDGIEPCWCETGRQKARESGQD